MTQDFDFSNVDWDEVSRKRRARAQVALGTEEKPSSLQIDQDTTYQLFRQSRDKTQAGFWEGVFTDATGQSGASAVVPFLGTVTSKINSDRLEESTERFVNKKATRDDVRLINDFIEWGERSQNSAARIGGMAGQVGAFMGENAITAGVFGAAGKMASAAVKAKAAAATARLASVGLVGGSIKAAKTAKGAITGSRLGQGAKYVLDSKVGGALLKPTGAVLRGVTGAESIVGGIGQTLGKEAIGQFGGALAGVMTEDDAGYGASRVMNAAHLRYLGEKYDYNPSEFGLEIVRNDDVTLLEYMPRELLDQFIENWTEQVGGSLTMGLAALNKSINSTFLEKMLGRATAEGMEAGTRRVFDRVASTGYNGYVNEVYEEVLGASARQLAGMASGDEDWSDSYREFWTTQNWLEMSAGIALGSGVAVTGARGFQGALDSLGGGAEGVFARTVQEGRDLRKQLQQAAIEARQEDPSLTDADPQPNLWQGELDEESQLRKELYNRALLVGAQQEIEERKKTGDPDIPTAEELLDTQRVLLDAKYGSQAMQSVQKQLDDINSMSPERRASTVSDLLGAPIAQPITIDGEPVVISGEGIRPLPAEAPEAAPEAPAPAMEPEAAPTEEAAPTVPEGLEMETVYDEDPERPGQLAPVAQERDREVYSRGSEEASQRANLPVAEYDSLTPEEQRLVNIAVKSNKELHFVDGAEFAAVHDKATGKILIDRTKGAQNAIAVQAGGQTELVPLSPIQSLESNFLHEGFHRLVRRFGDRWLKYVGRQMDASMPGVREQNEARYRQQWEQRQQTLPEEQRRDLTDEQAYEEGVSRSLESFVGYMGALVERNDIEAFERLVRGDIMASSAGKLQVRENMFGTVVRAIEDGFRAMAFMAPAKRASIQNLRNALEGVKGMGGADVTKLSDEQLARQAGLMQSFFEAWRNAGKGLDQQEGTILGWKQEIEADRRPVSIPERVEPAPAAAPAVAPEVDRLTEARAELEEIRKKGKKSTVADRRRKKRLEADIAVMESQEKAPEPQAPVVETVEAAPEPAPVAAEAEAPAPEPAPVEPLPAQPAAPDYEGESERLNQAVPALLSDLGMSEQTSSEIERSLEGRDLNAPESLVRQSLPFQEGVTAEAEEARMDWWQGHDENVLKERESARKANSGAETLGSNDAQHNLPIYGLGTVAEDGALQFNLPQDNRGIRSALESEPRLMTTEEAKAMSDLLMRESLANPSLRPLPGLQPMVTEAEADSDMVTRMNVAQHTDIGSEAAPFAPKRKSRLDKMTPVPSAVGPAFTQPINDPTGRAISRTMGIVSTPDGGLSYTADLTHEDQSLGVFAVDVPAVPDALRRATAEHMLHHALSAGAGYMRVSDQALAEEIASISKAKVDDGLISLDAKVYNRAGESYELGRLKSARDRQQRMMGYQLWSDNDLSFNLDDTAKPAPTVTTAPTAMMSYEKLDAMLETYLSRLDRNVHYANLMSQQHEQALVGMLPEDASPTEKAKHAQRYGRAIHLYIDLMGNDEGLPMQDLVTRFREEMAAKGQKISEQQEEMIQDALNLSGTPLELAQTIARENLEFGTKLRDAGLIGNAREWYSARLWFMSPKDAEGKDFTDPASGAIDPTRAGGRFLTGVGARAKARVYNSILDGWVDGLKLTIDNAIIAQHKVFRDGNEALANAGFAKTLKDNKIVVQVREGRSVPDGFKRIKSSSRSFDGFYAPASFADELSALTSRFSWEGFGKAGRPLRVIYSLQARTKSTLLFTSLFHHQAFMRSYFFSIPDAKGQVGDIFTLARASFQSLFSPNKATKTLMQSKAAKEGWDAIMSYSPELDLLVANGLTLGLGLDYSQKASWDSNWRTTWVEEAVGRVNKEAAEGLANKRIASSNWLFGKLGTSLKAQAGLLEYRHLIHKNKADLDSGKITRSQIAAIVASKTNDDFGGLNLRRGKQIIGGARQPGTQLALRLFFLAPDWTESNFNTVWKLAKSTAIAPDTDDEGQKKLREIERKAYGNMYVQAMVRTQIPTLIFNAIMAGIDDEETLASIYSKSWNSSFDEKSFLGVVPTNFNFMSADITWLAKTFDEMVGIKGNPKHGNSRLYFNGMGHFMDPAKWATGMLNFDLLGPVKAKAGPIVRFISNAASGENWRGMTYTPIPEMLVKDGDRWRVQLTKWEFGSGAVGAANLPSFLLDEATNSLPIFMQSGFRTIAGEDSAFDFLADAFGFHVKRQFDKRSSGNASRATFMMGSL